MRCPRSPESRRDRLTKRVRWQQYVSRLVSNRFSRRETTNEEHSQAMYIPQGPDSDTETARSVMGALDDGRFVIADLEREDRWMSVARAVTADLENTR